MHAECLAGRRGTKLAKLFTANREAVRPSAPLTPELGTRRTSKTEGQGVGISPRTLVHLLAALANPDPLHRVPGGSPPSVPLVSDADGTCCAPPVVAHHLSNRSMADGIGVWPQLLFWCPLQPVSRSSPTCSRTLDTTDMLPVRSNPRR